MTRPVIHSTHRRTRILRALVRGLCNRCPNCGRGSWRMGYLMVVPVCRVCGVQLGHIRADDGPAYFTVLIVAHIMVPATLVVESRWHPPLLPHLTIALTILGLLIWQLLPRIKGAMVALMWILNLTGDEVQGDVDRHG